MSRKQAYVYFYASYCDKINQILALDILWLKIRIPDKNNLFATLISVSNIQCTGSCFNTVLLILNIFCMNQCFNVAKQNILQKSICLFLSVNIS